MRSRTFRRALFAAFPLPLLLLASCGPLEDGSPVPYFLSGTLRYQVLEGTVLQGSGKTELDLTSGEISTRPSGSVTDLLSGLL